MSSTAQLRTNARRKIEEGAVTVAYAADRDQVLKMLNEALALVRNCAVLLIERLLVDEFLLGSLVTLLMMVIPVFPVFEWLGPITRRPCARRAWSITN